MLQRLLLSIDESPSGEVGLAFAASLARQDEASVRVFHANELLIGGRGVTHETHDEAVSVLERAVAELRDAGLDASGETALVNCFTLAPRIVEAAERFGADVIVLGSHRHRRFGRLLGRGVRERVIRITSLPVLTAPAPLRITGHRRGSNAELRRLSELAETPQGR